MVIGAVGVVAGEVLGTAVTGVLVVLVGHVVVAALGLSLVTGGMVPQPGPLHVPVLVMVPVASDAFAVTEKVSVYEAPGATPTGMVQLIVDPLRETVHVGGPPLRRLAEPETSVVPVGAASVTMMGSVVAAEPLFFTVSV